MIQRRSLLLYSLVLTSASFAAAQTSPGTAPATSAPGQPPPSTSTTPAAATAAPSTAVVPENTAVITIDGVCEISLNGTAKTPAHAHAAPSKTAARKAAPAAQPSTACKTQITRAEFEKLLKAVAPGAPATVHRQIAARYVQLLTAANEGVKLGLNKDPEFEEQLAIAHLQVLAQTAERKLQSEAANVSEADEKTYYDQNPSAFEEVTLTRIFVPRNPSSPASGTQQQPSSGDAQAVADAAQKQLASGEDPEKVEKSAYEQLKNTATPPSTKFGARRRGSLPPAQEAKVFALNPGEVSEVFSDSVGYMIYKLDSKKELPFEQVKDEIKRRLTQQHLEDSRTKIMNASKAEYNDAYFGPESPAVRPAPPRMPPTPPAGAAATPSTPTQSTSPK